MPNEALRRFDVKIFCNKDSIRQNIITVSTVRLKERDESGDRGAFS